MTGENESMDDRRVACVLRQCVRCERHFITSNKAEPFVCIECRERAA